MNKQEKWFQKEGIEKEMKLKIKKREFNGFQFQSSQNPESWPDGIYEDVVSSTGYYFQDDHIKREISNGDWIIQLDPVVNMVLTNAQKEDKYE